MSPNSYCLLHRTKDCKNIVILSETVLYTRTKYSMQGNIKKTSLFGSIARKVKILHSHFREACARPHLILVKK